MASTTNPSDVGLREEALRAILWKHFGGDDRYAAIGQAIIEIRALVTGYQVSPDAYERAPKHQYWGAGEPDCPKDIKAGNGELHTMRCKICELDNPRNPICHADALFARAALAAAEPQRELTANLLKALETLSDLFARDGENSLERFERLAAMFHRDTGYLAPGKDAPAAGAMQPDGDELRRTYDDWYNAKIVSARSAIARARGEQA